MGLKYRREWWWGFGVLIALILAIDWYAELDALGATARFLGNILVAAWRLLVEAAIVLWRIILEGVLALWRFIVFGAERFSIIVAAIATSKVARIFTGIAASVTLEYMFAGAWTSKVRTLKERARRAGTSARLWWLKQHLLTKLGIVICMIVIQISLHWVILLFPIGFMVPYLIKTVRFIQKTVLDNAVSKWYLSRFGRFHGTVIRTLRTHLATRSMTARMRGTRLFFHAGWRIWRYDPRFRHPERSFWYREVWMRCVFAATTLPRGEWLAKYHAYRTCRLLSGAHREQRKEAAE